MCSNRTEILYVFFLALLHGVFCLASPTLKCRNGGSHLSAATSSFGSMSPLIARDYRIAHGEPKRLSLWERFTFAWASKLISLGNEKPLELNDLWQLDDSSSMKNLNSDFQDRLKFELEQLNATSYNPTVGRLVGSTSLQQFWSSPIIKALVKMYSRQLTNTGLLKFVNTCVQFLPSLLVARLLQNVDLQAAAADTTARMLLRKQGVVMSTLLFFVLSLKTIIENQYFYSVVNMSGSVRGALSTAIYDKALKLSPQGRTNNTVGEIVNYMQIDTARIEMVAGTIHTMWDGFFQVVGYTSLLLHYLGVSVLAGIATMIVIIPVNAYFLKKLSIFRAENLKMTDARVKLTNEALSGINAIKCYGWESLFLSKLLQIRTEEIKKLKACANTRAILVSMLSAAPSIVAVVVLSIYALIGNELTPVKVFTALALFNQLRFPLIFLPMLLNNLAEGKVSLQRLSKFLMSDEVKNYREDIDLSKGDEKGTTVAIQGGTFAWENSPSVSMLANSTMVANNNGLLKDINVQIMEKELVAVVGPVGSGKSTLVAALLGELNKQNGRVAIAGSVAYVSQSAWIPNDSLKNVILFDNPVDEVRYQGVIDDCFLRRDIELLDAGDETEIGERAVNLSGGQKQRVNLARAVYDDADIYLMDDPLSALDAEVGGKVFQHCIKERLKNKTRILVTHQLSLLPQVDRIIVMTRSEEGVCSILDQGTFGELISRGHDFSKMVKFPFEETKTAPNNSTENKKDTAAESNIRKAIANSAESREVTMTECVEVTESVKGESKRRENVSTNIIETSCPEELILQDDKMSVKKEGTTLLPAVSLSSPVETGINTETASPLKKGGTKLMVEEERVVGSVKFDIYRWYMTNAKKPKLILALIFSFLLANASQQLQQFVVSAWTSDLGYKKRPLSQYLAGVSSMAAGVAIFNWSRTYITCLLGAAASEDIHAKLTRNVLNAPLSFFESMQMGRLLQRFTKDLDQVDQQLPSSFGQFIASTLNIISAMVAIIFVTPSFSGVVLPILVMYANITNFYRSSARELKRIDSISRSPIFAHFGETLDGLSVIRSYGRQDNFKRGNERRLDDNISAYFSLKAVDRWLSVRLELLGNLVVFTSALLVTVTKSRAGSSGLSLNNALGVTSLLNWAVRNGAELESYMNSVERVKYTTYETPQEAARVVEAAISSTSVSGLDKDTLALVSSNTTTAVATETTPLVAASSDAELLNSGWPWQGGISFRNVNMRYREDFDPVLQGVSLDISPGQMIGVVGRTGSGKSSLFRALLRLTECEHGKITIDGVDIQSIGLDTLRMSIGVIPQESVLFSGTVRDNLDPTSVCTDEVLWDALRRVNMQQTINALPGALNFDIKEGGYNFSLGQQQLLCLARALIRKCPILLLDEATSSVDYKTDQIIQRAIRQEIQKRKCTVITIAHRLETVMDADRIVVMDRGRVGEFNKPQQLLKNENSLLTQLVEADT